MPVAIAWPVDVRLVPHPSRNHRNDCAMFYTKLNDFLLSVDVVGQSSSEVEKQLGKPFSFTEKRLGLLKSINVNLPVDESGCKSIYYRIPRDGAEPRFYAVRFKLHNDKVKQWSIVNNSDETEPITQNVIIMFDPGGSVIFSEAKGFRYPRTVAKTNLVKKFRRDLVDEATRVEGRKRSTSASSGRTEGPRDINMFKVEPTVKDERPFFSP